MAQALASNHHLLIWNESGVHWALPTRKPQAPPAIEALLQEAGGVSDLQKLAAQDLLLPMRQGRREEFSVPTDLARRLPAL